MIRSLSPLLALGLFTACADAPLEADGPSCDAILASRTTVGAIPVYGGSDQPIPEAVFTEADDWEGFRAEQGLPELEVDFATHQVHTTNVWTQLDCEYLDDTTGQLRVVRLDDASLGVVAPMARSRAGCSEQSVPLMLVVVLEAQETGSISSYCPLR